MEQERYTVILFYKFFHVENPAALRESQRALCVSLNLKGRMLIAHEGVNATFEGRADDVIAYKVALKQIPEMADIVMKESEGTGKGFTKLMVKVRPEIVTLGAGSFDVQTETAPEVTAGELDTMYANNEDFVVLDLRNDFEIEAGQFEKTVHPDLRNFRDLPDKLEAINHLKDKKVIAVCTGGIRCEKATCLLKKAGFSNIYQLKDGIHTYMQQFPGKHFKGSLFVFDNRMVTPVVPTDNLEIIGRCKFCNTSCETFYSDDTTRPSTKIICCDGCYTLNADRLRTCV